jgi:hypothetical protein
VRLPHNDEGTAALIALLREHLIERVALPNPAAEQSARGAGLTIRDCVVCPGRSQAPK